MVSSGKLARLNRPKSLIYLLLGVGLAFGFIAPILFDFNGLLLAANLALRALLPLTILGAILTCKTPLLRSTWGYFLGAALFDGFASLVFMFSIPEQNISSSPIISPLGDISQLASYAMVTLGLHAMRQTQQAESDWRIPTLNATASVLAIGTILWVVVAQGATGDSLATPAATVRFLIELGYPLLDFVMLGSMVIAHTHRNPAVSNWLLWGITIFVLCLFSGDALIGSGIYLTQNGALLLKLAGMFHGVGITALAVTALGFRETTPVSTRSIIPVESPTWHFSTVSVAALFLTMLFIAQLRFGPLRGDLSVEVIAMSLMSIAGLMILLRQGLGAKHVQKVLEQQIRQRTLDLEQTQQELQATNRSLLSLVEHAPMAICARNAAGEASITNHTWREIARVCPDLITWSPDTHDADTVLEFSLVGTDHVKRTFIGITSDFINQSGNLDGEWLIITDLSEIKSQEAKVNAISRLASLGELATNLAHELNQPLNALRLTNANIGRLLQSHPIDVDTIRLKLKRADDIVTRCATLIQQMRTYGRAAPADAEVFDIKHRLDVVQDLIGAQLKQERIELEFDLPGEPALAFGPPLEFDQVLINLITNARDAILSVGETGKISFSIVSNQTEHHIVVRDSGPGFPEHFLHRLLEPFFTTKPVGEGTGLGLSITHGIISDMGGRVTLENHDRGGAIVYLDIPKAANPDKSD